MFKQLNVWKNVRNLFLRYFMICVFMFMCMIIISAYPKILGPLFGVFYFIALIYYFWFTMKAEGEKDVNRVSIGQMPYFRWKGLLCAGVLAVPLILINLIPHSFADPIRYREYFTGSVTVIEESAQFNTDLRAASGQKGYIREVLFEENGTLDQVIYITSNGYYIKCDGTAKDTSKIYAASLSPLSLTTKNDENVVYYNEKTTSATTDTSVRTLTDEEVAAFAECRNALNDISEVMGEYPTWQKVLSVLKVVFAVALQYFCGIFTQSPVISSVIYAVCLLILCGAAQVGYEMGYRNISFLRKKKPTPTGAGDSITIQRGKSADRE